MATTSTKEPIVFVPGLACTRDLFVPQASALNEHQLTYADTCDASSTAKMAERILQSAPDKFALTGLSMGGYVALEILRIAPERVSRLALLSTNARADTPEKSSNRKRQIQIAKKGKYSEIIRGDFLNLVHPARHEDAPLKSLHRKMAEEVGPANYILQQEALISRRDQRDMLHTISVPTLIVVGEQDNLSPPTMAQEMHDAITASKLEILSNCGHLSTLEKPETVNRLIKNWLLN